MHIHNMDREKISNIPRLDSEQSWLQLKHALSKEDYVDIATSGEGEKPCDQSHWSKEVGPN